MRIENEKIRGTVCFWFVMDLVILLLYFVAFMTFKMIMVAVCLLT